MRATANAKVNLGLRVHGRREDGLHLLQGLFQSIDWSDQLELERADEDMLESAGGAVPDGMENLAWRAVNAVRQSAEAAMPMALRLRKEIPVASGLGGGSADAAAALALAGRMFGVSTETLGELAPDLGADVPFCLVGGLAVVTGAGESVSPMPARGGYSLAIVVPPVELATAAVYQAWDRLGGPGGPPVSGRDLPPTLRDLEPLTNDLYPAAVELHPALDDWRDELATRWDRPVLLSGSGPALYAFFIDGDGAHEAVADVPIGARAVAAADPVCRGWAFT